MEDASEEPLGIFVGQDIGVDGPETVEERAGVRVLQGQSPALRHRERPLEVGWWLRRRRATETRELPGLFVEHREPSPDEGVGRVASAELPAFGEGRCIQAQGIFGVARQLQQSQSPTQRTTPAESGPSSSRYASRVCVRRPSAASASPMADST